MGNKPVNNFVKLYLIFMTDLFLFLFFIIIILKTSFNKSKNELLAVMVWIHGGEFIAGEINSKLYGPDFLVADNVVLVDMNYRLGALGKFLVIIFIDYTRLCINFK